MLFIFAIFPTVVSGGSPVHGGRLTVALANPPIHFNPALQSGTLTGLVGTQIFAGLLRFDAQGNPQPYLARDWRISEDGLTVTLHLVENAVFHDGQPITSADVAFSMEIVQKYHPFQNMFAPVVGVDTPAADTVVIRLQRPHPAILLALSPILLPILPRHIYGDGQDILTHPANIQTVGSGPFRLIEYVPGRQIRLQRFEKFFIPDRPYLDEMVFQIFFDPNEIPQALEHNDIQLLSYSLILDDLQRLVRQGRLVVTRKAYRAVGPMMWLAFNLDQKPFDDLRVRQAFAYAIDRDFIVQTVMNNTAQKLTGPIVPDNPFYTNQVEDYHRDLAKANLLLDAAGYPRRADGKRFTLELDYTPDEASLLLPLIQYLRQDLARGIGVELKIRTATDFQEWAKWVSNGNFQATIDIVFTWGDPLIGVHRTYDSRNIKPGLIWSNTQHYRNPLVDKIMDSAGSETDFEKRKAWYAQFQQILVRELPVLWISTVPYVTIHHQDLAGLEEDMWATLGPLDKVYWKNDGGGKK
ncbi:MAG: ABC transporter substrate-binding protein [Deltaproteobacteria bacterium]|nr:ABC transporter substrate-binding protein [Deltaproteobacteria bacterium]